MRKIPKGSKLIWQVHYTPTGKEEKDRSRLGIIFADGPEKEVLRTAFAVNDDFKIPPHHDDYVVEASKKIPADATIYSFTPHMHYRGKAMDFFLKYPDGKEVLACSVPAYDFNWQLDYQLKEPLRVPAGTASALWDASTTLPTTPTTPTPPAVRWGEQTWEEMLMGGIFLSWADETPPSSPLRFTLLQEAGSREPAIFHAAPWGLFGLQPVLLALDTAWTHEKRSTGHE